MENAVQALRMAAAVLIFIIALGTSFRMFGLAKTTADSIIGMRDKQSYLQVAEVDNGILYTSNEAVSEAEGVGSTKSKVPGVTTSGDRIVNPDDVISTIYRYAAEKYAVTVIYKDGSDWKVLARFDSSIESIIQNNSNNISSTGWNNLAKQIRNNLQNSYAVPTDTNFTGNHLKSLYTITTALGTNGYGAPWLGNNTEIQKRINEDIVPNTTNHYSYNGQKYEGKDIFKKLTTLVGGNLPTIIEITNEIDESTYKFNGSENTGLIEEYQMPTVEVIYILKYN